MFKARQGVTVTDGHGVQGNFDIQTLSAEKFQAGCKKTSLKSLSQMSDFDKEQKRLKSFLLVKGYD